MSTIAIIQASIIQLKELQNISRTTFYETFSSSNSEEDMLHYLKEKLSIEQLSKELLTPDSQFFLAYEDEQVIGYLKINTKDAQTEKQDLNALEIERIYVLKSHQGKKIGQLLFQKAIEIAREIHIEYIWLGVWEQNQKAIKFYEKNGFEAFDKHIFVLGEDQQTDIMMRKYISNQG